MKKLLALLLAVLMVASFAACSSGGGSGDKGSTKGEISVFYYTFSDAYISTVRSSMDKILSDSGYTYNDYDANATRPRRPSRFRPLLQRALRCLSSMSLTPVQTMRRRTSSISPRRRTFLLYSSTAPLSSPLSRAMTSAYSSALTMSRQAICRAR